MLGSPFTGRSCAPCARLTLVVRPTLFDHAGGMEAFERLAAAHHQRCLDDPVLNHPFSHPGQPDHVERLAHYWAEVLGGPARYSERYGNNSSVLEIHAGTQAEDELGLRFIACFVGALDDARLPNDREFRAAMRSYMTWAVGDVMSYAPRDAAVPGGRSLPHWGWDGLVPD